MSLCRIRDGWKPFQALENLFNGGIIHPIKVWKEDGIEISSPIFIFFFQLGKMWKSRWKQHQTVFVFLILFFLLHLRSFIHTLLKKQHLLNISPFIFWSDMLLCILSYGKPWACHFVRALSLCEEIFSITMSDGWHTKRWEVQLHSAWPRGIHTFLPSDKAN